MNLYIFHSTGIVCIRLLPTHLLIAFGDYRYTMQLSIYLVYRVIQKGKLGLLIIMKRNPAEISSKLNSNYLRARAWQDWG